MKNLLKKVPMFHDFNDEDLEYLQEISTLKTYQKDSIIFFRGDDAKNLYILLEGSLKIYKNNTNNNEIILKIINNTSLVAELANLEHMPYPSSCATLGESKVLVVNFKKFEKHFLTNPKFLLMFVKSLTKTMLLLEQIISLNLTLSSTSKVAKQLYQTSSNIYKISHKIRASTLNMAPETYSRIIRKFKNEKLIQEEKGHVIILDEKKLRSYFDM